MIINLDCKKISCICTTCGNKVDRIIQIGKQYRCVNCWDIDIQKKYSEYIKKNLH